MNSLQEKVMPKKIFYESFVYRTLAECSEISSFFSGEDKKRWTRFVESLEFKNQGKIVSIITPCKIFEAPINGATFYKRGDINVEDKKQIHQEAVLETDEIKALNKTFFNDLVKSIALANEFHVGECKSTSSTTEKEKLNIKTTRRFNAEKKFHDQWAESENLEHIDVIKANEACTSPEIRFISKKLGKIEGKSLLDIGCGLGEVSVYFALKGADVTACDISEGMLNSAKFLAKKNKVHIRTHLTAAEDLKFPKDSSFDVIYAGNLFHHVDIDQTLDRVKPHIKPDGILVSWDPIAYNPLINIYRKIAKKVRTEDEHPLTVKDIDRFRNQFKQVELRYFWFSTLIIFIIMALVQRRNPNKERYWKMVITEADKWAPIYKPLEKFDNLILKFLPPLRFFCWNVVILCRN